MMEAAIRDHLLAVLMDHPEAAAAATVIPRATLSPMTTHGKTGPALPIR
jgi:hypothetical protein